MIFQTEFVSDVASDFLKQMIILKSFDSVLNMYPSLSACFQILAEKNVSILQFSMCD